MEDRASRVAALIRTAVAKIGVRPVPQPNAWELHQLSEALCSIEVDDVDRAERALDRLGCTPEAVDLDAVWRTPPLTLAQIEARVERMHGLSPRAD